MSRFGKHHCKYLHLIYTSNVTGPLFHTTRNSVLPILAREDQSDPELGWLQCLRPAGVRVTTAPTLAGEPRAPSQRDHGIKPEIVERWTTQTPRYDIYKEWSKLSVFY